MYCPKCGSFNENQTPNEPQPFLNCKYCFSMYEINERIPITLQELIRMTRYGDKVPAIKKIREQTYWGLRDSKILVDLIIAISRNESVSIERTLKDGKTS